MELEIGFDASIKVALLIVINIQTEIFNGNSKPGEWEYERYEFYKKVYNYIKNQQ